MIVPQPLVLRYDQLALIFSGCEVPGFKGPFEQSQVLEVGDAADASYSLPSCSPSPPSSSPSTSLTASYQMASTKHAFWNT